MRKVKLVSKSVEETIAIGEHFGASLPPDAVVALYGDLGAGKTAFVKGIVQGARAGAHHEVQSPTFTYLHIYFQETSLYHFDLYRLKGADDFIRLGFQEFLQKDAICCLEWAERIPDLLPPETIAVHLTSLDLETRVVEIL